MPRLLLLSYFVAGTLFYANVDCALVGPPDGNDTLPCGNVTSLDAVYFSVVTLTTVGYGDLGPKTQGTRVFTCIFALYGISVASVSLGIIIDELAKLKARRAGRASGSVALNKHLGTVNASDELLAKTWSGDAKEKREAVEALSVEEDMLAAKPPSIWCEIAKDMWKTFTCGFFGEMLASVMSLAGVIGTGTLYYWLEVKQRPEVQAGEDGATVVDSLYYAIITGTTIGYGDEYPMTEGGKFFAIFFLPAATLTLCTLVGELATLPFKRRAARMDEMVLKQFGEFLTASELRILTSTGNGKACTKDQCVLQNDAARSRLARSLLHRESL